MKDDDDNFKLGKQGTDVEFCFICNTIRVCRLFNLEGMCFNIVCIMVVVSCKVMKMLHQEGHVLVNGIGISYIPSNHYLDLFQVLLLDCVM